MIIVAACSQGGSQQKSKKHPPHQQTKVVFVLSLERPSKSRPAKSNQISVTGSFIALNNQVFGHRRRSRIYSRRASSLSSLPLLPLMLLSSTSVSFGRRRGSWWIPSSFCASCLLVTIHTWVGILWICICVIRDWNSVSIYGRHSIWLSQTPETKFTVPSIYDWKHTYHVLMCPPKIDGLILILSIKSALGL